jgi:membrane protein CcdC involved in cytochrome C biogenesis
MIMPAFLFIITIILVQGIIFSSLTNFFLIVVGFIIGLLIGYAVGSFMDVKIDEKDGRMILKGSYIAVGIWIFVIIVKVYGKGILGNSQYMDLGVLSSLILMLTLGAMISRRILIYRKYRNFKINRDKNIGNNSV